jgi:hypothetical protein
MNPSSEPVDVRNQLRDVFRKAKTQTAPAPAPHPIRPSENRADETAELPSRSEVPKVPKAVPDGSRAILEAAEAARPPDVFDAPWRAAMDGLKVFLLSGHGDEAERLGWPAAELYAVPKLWSQIHLCGVALLIGDREVIEVTADEIRIRTGSGATLAFRRAPPVDYGLAYFSRLKQAGLDATLEETQLRCRESVVRLWLANHPGSSSIDEARVAIDAIITQEKAR